jgi:Ribbon-helix-helix domain
MTNFLSFDALASQVSWLRPYTFFWYNEAMEPTRIELTPEQTGLLATLSRETGKPIPALLDEALEALQEREHGRHEAPAPPSPTAPMPIWEQFADAFKDVPEEELARLPIDGAAQHDHYIYGWPKREV